MSDPYSVLGEEVLAAARRQESNHRASTSLTRSQNVRQHRPHGGPFGLITAVLVLLGVSAAALAASGILTGSPVRTSHPSPPRSGIGAPIASSARLLSINFPDPEGGLPWGVRSFRTTRGLICLQIGRVYEGKVGALVNGRFRPFSLSLPSSSIREEPLGTGPRTLGGCHLPGEMFSWEVSNAPASAYVFHHQRGPIPMEKATQVRFMDFGALGPRGRSATYELGGRFHTVAVEPGSGVFLIVLPEGGSAGIAARPLYAGGGEGPGPLSPGGPESPVRHYTYDIRGHSCLVSRLGTNTCLPWLKPLTRLPHTRYLHEPVAVVANPVHGRRGSLVVSFRAPYAITSAASDYQVLAPVACVGSFGGTIRRDVSKGELLHVRVNYESADVRKCGPSMRVQAIYVSSPREAIAADEGRGGVIVGETTIATPK